MTATTASIAQPPGFAWTRNHVFRYVAALGGLVALLAFYQPWVRAELNAIGETPLTGLELARGDATNRVDLAVFGGSARPGSVSGAPGAASGAGATPASGASGAASLGGLTLPTRQPTAAAGSQGASQVVGGLTLPTRQPTAAAGSAGASQLVGGASSAVAAASLAAEQATATALSNPSLPGGVPIAAAVPPPPQPDTLANVLLYLVPVMGLGVAAFSIVWDRLSDLRDRRYGKAWTLILSIGGAFWVGSVLYKAATAPDGNSLIGPGVGGVTAAEPALWATFLGFLLAAICLILAWLSPAPPPPDPYYRVRAQPSTGATAPST